MSISLPRPSSSAKIYATAKKEWVIPPRAKPGRKPKAVQQDDLDYDQDNTTDNSKRSQNRSAQKAFRERKQSQFTELQAKLQQYEQGEIGRSVVLQNLGRRLKEENDQLKAENAALKAELEQLTLRLAAMSVPSGEPSAAVQPSVANAEQRGRGAKRERNESVPPPGLRAKRLKTTDIPQLQMSSANSSTLSHQVISPLPYDFEGGGAELRETGSDHYMSPSIVENTATSQFPSCGMCTSSIDCLCRQLGLGDPTSISQSEPDDNNPLSILNNLPPYQPPVPLPPRPKAMPTLLAGPAEIIKSKHAKQPGCSGDPSNCKACADNAFGRAFCTALGSSVCTRNSCTTCRPKASPSYEKAISTSARPEPSSPISVNPSLLQCCGNAVHCKRDDCSSINAQTAKATSCDIKELVTVPCDVVWKTLEAHPNAHLANPTLGPSQLTNLHILAEVVARNSRCTLKPGETEVEPEDFPARHWSVHPADGDNQSELRSAARVQIGYEDDQAVRGSERTMVPRDVLQGHRRVITVQREGIRDAIALLDRQFGCT